MAKILITGATGFVGQHLIPALLKQGHEIRCAVSRVTPTLPVECVKVNLLDDEPNWQTALHGIEIVIHLAAKVHVMDSSSLEEYCQINSLATRDLAKQASQSGVKRFIFLSSIKVNGEFSEPGAPFTEQSTPKPQDAYGFSKLYAEKYLHEISQCSEMEIVILRAPLIYGPKVKANFLKMLHWTKKQWPLPFAAIDNQRHFIYIENLVAIFLEVMTHPNAANQTYLVADDESFSLSQLLQAISQEMGLKSRLFPLPASFMHFLFKCVGQSGLRTRLLASLEVNNQKLKSHLGWQPSYTALEGLQKTISWYQNEFNA